MSRDLLPDAGSPIGAVTDHSIATDLVLDSIIRAMNAINPNARAKVAEELEHTIKGLNIQNPDAARSRQQAFDFAREIVAG